MRRSLQRLARPALVLGLLAAPLLSGCSLLHRSGSSPSSPSNSKGTAQPPLNWRASPFFGTLNLRGGFTPDPTTIEVRAGGSTPNPLSGSGCKGFLTTTAPDVDVNYSGSGSLSLTFSATSDTDISMVVYTADGRWLCDDDSGGNLNPKITIARPAAGNYNVWIATYRTMSDRPTATVGVSELGRMAN